MAAEESAVLVLLVARAGEWKSLSLSVELHLELWSRVWGLRVRVTGMETAHSE